MIHLSEIGDESFDFNDFQPQIVSCMLHFFTLQ